MSDVFKSGMFGEHRFKVGQRVRVSYYGKAGTLFRIRPDRTGVVTKVDQFNCPTVLWEHRKTATSYHPIFIEIDRRRKTRR